MDTHNSISGPEATDRLEIHELVDAYARFADRRDAKGQISLLRRMRISLYSWMLNLRNLQRNLTGVKTWRQYLTTLINMKLQLIS